MQVVILAAGRGKQMKKLSKDTNKNMLKLSGKPILEYKINALPRKIKEIIFIVGYHCEDIMKHFGQYFNGRRITYVFQDNLNGTGGALHLARSVIRDKFLVMMGDDLYHKKDLAEIVKHDLAIMGHEVEDITKFGIIKSKRGGLMESVVEKPKRSKEKLAATGVYVLDKTFFDYELVPIGGGEFGLPQTMAEMAKDKKIKIHKARAWHPIGCAQDLEKAEEIIGSFL